MKKVKLVIASMGVFALCLISTDSNAGKWEENGQAFVDSNGFFFQFMNANVHF